jgi:hypothetical protein
MPGRQARRMQRDSAALQCAGGETRFHSNSSAPAATVYARVALASVAVSVRRRLSQNTTSR